MELDKSGITLHRECLEGQGVLLLPAVLQLATVHRSPGPGRGHRQGHGEASRGPASLIFSVCVDELKCSDNRLAVQLETKVREFSQSPRRSLLPYKDILLV